MMETNREEPGTRHLYWETVPRVCIGNRIYLDQQDVLILMSQLDEEYKSLGEQLLGAEDQHR